MARCIRWCLVPLLWSAAAQAELVIRVAAGADASERIERAIVAARRVRGSTVRLAAGTFRLSRSLRLGAADTGLRIVADGRSVLTGTLALAAMPVPPDLAARLPTAARRHARAYRLPDAAVRRFGAEAPRTPGNFRGATLLLTQEHAPLRPSVWPNAGYAVQETAEPRQGPGIAPVLPIPSGKADTWAAERAIKVGGYFSSAWWYDEVWLSAVDRHAGVLRLPRLDSRYAEAERRRYRVFNAVGEIDQPGEYAVDVGRGIAIVWPAAAGPVELAAVDDLVVVDGASDVRLDGVALRGAGRDALVIRNGTGIAFANGYLGQTGRYGASVAATVTHSAIGRTVIVDTGGTGVQLDGGDLATMRAGNNRVYDCVLLRFGHAMRSYQAGVRFAGVANSVTGSYFADAPHSAILFEGADHRILGNEITRTNLETGDAGAIYVGPGHTSRGTEIARNYLHDIHRNPGLPEVAGVYLDGYTGGQVVERNLFVDVDLPVWINSGTDNVVADNVFVRPTLAALDLRDLSASYGRGAGVSARRSLDGLTAALTARFGAGLTSLRAWNGAPRGNRLRGNVRLGGAPMHLPASGGYVLEGPDRAGPAPAARGYAAIAVAVGAAGGSPVHPALRRRALSTLNYIAAAGPLGRVTQATTDRLIENKEARGAARRRAAKRVRHLLASREAGLIVLASGTAALAYLALRRRTAPA